ncbi:MAG TPA: rhomboid family intramembrane serine protease [Clostridia bacterium]|nr:rhomboid family intramembrane serine protease [Clostridia bacterium]
MIPIRDSVRSRRFPIMTVFIILLNVLVFLHEISLSDPDRLALFMRFGVVPSRISGVRMPEASAFALTPLISATFLHGSWLHIIGNMLFLWVFGDNVEDKMGRLRFLCFYLLVGIIANFTHVLANPASTVPTVGASGAVAGVLGAYFLLFPGARVLALVPVGIFVPIAEVPAFVFLFVWFLLQVFSGVASLGAAGQSVQAVAWWAHIGGFLSGMILLFPFLPAKSRTRR